MVDTTFEFSIVIHYSEIGLKKNNRSYFEKIFIHNISEHIKDLKHGKIKLVSARIIIDNIDLNNWNDFRNRLTNVMGLSSAILMMKINSDFNIIKKSMDYFINTCSFETFRVTTKRHFKGFKKTSLETNIELGSYIQNKTNKKVKLSGADLDIIIEILKDKTYIGYDKIIGYGGLPSGTQEKALSLLSSGIDSPVASFEMIKRGVNVEYVHFHSYPAISKQSIDNTKEIVKILCKYGLNATLYVVPILPIQEKIMELVKDKFWVIFFRRAMVKLSSMLAEKNNAVALITGESIGQVASQTLSNIRAIEDVSTFPVIRPLSGMNKEEIINKAKIIGTYETSIKPYQDCCSHFVPVHPETKAKLNEILTIDSHLDISKEYDVALNNIETVTTQFLES